MRILLTFIAVTITFLSGVTATAQTPDEQTPANEGVCDNLQGLTPGLYGLCVAFCEAQDLDLIDFDNPDTFKHVPSNRILDQYRKRMQQGDPDMPCIQQSECPCWTPEELAGLPLPTGTDTAECRKDSDLRGAVNLDHWTLWHGIVSRHPVTSVASVEDSETPSLGRFCAIFDTCTDGNCLNVIRGFRLTFGELVACEADVASSAADRGLDLTQLNCGI